MAVVSLSNESTLIRTDSNRLERIQAISRRYTCLRVPARACACLSACLSAAFARFVQSGSE
ncbi:hypothetical protein BTO02_11190 [Paraburkholderia sp. SOS3]|nr:hypothetical protein BTO02_11190 [Paraburkholderia sp. SOS3]